MHKPQHPGRTPAERRALDAIGSGNFSPAMTNKTRNALLADGLIFKSGDKLIGRDALGDITRSEYAMPIPVHMAWCNAVAEEPEEEA